jgi:hypothetical protein
VQAAPAVQAALTALHVVLVQDLEPDPTTGQRRIRRGVAKNRQPSWGDPEMRHGRKTRARPANEPEHVVLERLTAAVMQPGPLADLWMERGYLASPEVPRLYARGVTLHVKPWTAHNGERFPKQAFTINVRGATVECPARQIAPIRPGRFTVQFSRGDLSRLCAAGGVHDGAARPITLHPEEALLQTLRATAHTPDGRATVRRRTTVEHSLARLDHIQGTKARYKGTRKNTLDVRRCATVANLQSLARLKHAA